MRPVIRQAQAILPLLRQAGRQRPSAPKHPGTALRAAHIPALHSPALSGLCQWPVTGTVSVVRRQQAQKLRVEKRWPDSAPQLLMPPRPHGPEARAKAQVREHSAARLQTYQHRGQQWPRPAHVPARLWQSSSFALSEHSTWLSIASLRCGRQLPGADFAQLYCHAGPLLSCTAMPGLC